MSAIVLFALLLCWLAVTAFACPVSKDAYYTVTAILLCSTCIAASLENR